MDLRSSKRRKICEEDSPAPTPNSANNIFALLSLPAEIRIAIYRAILTRPHALLLHARRPDFDAEAPNPNHALGTSLLLPGRNLCWRSGSDVKRRSQEDKDEEAALKPEPPLCPALLRACKQVHEEAREFLYKDNEFVLQVESGLYSLKGLTQRDRGAIKRVIVNIRSLFDIIDAFADLLRLGLRYCWKLERVRVVFGNGSGVVRGHTGGGPGTGMNTGAVSGPISSVAVVTSTGASVYANAAPNPNRRNLAHRSPHANAFHNLRWLPQQCDVVLEGIVDTEIMMVAEHEEKMRKTLDPKAYLRRQHLMPERF